MNKEDLESMYGAIKRIERMVALYMGGLHNVKKTAVDINLVKKQIETELDKLEI